MSNQVTAGCVVIGDEILSGRIQEGNAAFLAGQLVGAAISLKEVRIVSDEEDAIIEAVTTLSDRYDYVFTSGGIGPTHDDITADSVAKAFGLHIDVDPRAVDIMAPHYAAKGLEFTESRKRMARIPQGAELIDNPISKAPGFTVENVHVMAGVPTIFKAMLASILPNLRSGAPIYSATIPTEKGEGDIAEPLAAIQKEFPEVSIGSYPSYRKEGGFDVEIVLRSTDAALLNEAQRRVGEFL